MSGRPSTAMSRNEAEAGDFGFTRIVDPATHRVRWEIECRECHTVSSHGWSQRMSANLAIRSLRKAGWEVEHKRKPLCADCVKRKNDRGENVVDLKTNNDGAGLMAGPAKALLLEAVNTEVERRAAVGPDLKIARRVIGMLEEHFDDQLRVFRVGHSDQSIADSLGVSVEAVVKIRREAFGELAEDPKVKQMREDIELLAMEVADKEKDIIDLRERIVALGERMTKLFVKAV